MSEDFQKASDMVDDREARKVEDAEVVLLAVDPEGDGIAVADLTDGDTADDVILAAAIGVIQEQTNKVLSELAKALLKKGDL